METAADRAAMLSGLGGVPITGPRGTFVGVFEMEYVAVGDPVPVDSAMPRITADTAELARCGVVTGVTLRIGADVYIVRSPQPDGDGMTVLVIEGP